MLDTVCVQPSVNNPSRLTPVGMYLDELVTLLHQQGYARDTIRGYLHAWTQFGQWLGHQGYRVTDVDETLIQQYLRGCRRTRPGRQPKAADGLPHLLRLLRQWVHAPLPQRLTHDEVERVLATCANTTPHALRDRTILLLLGRLGLRAHEIVSLCLEDIDWHHGRLVIRPGKTHHARLLPLSQELGSTLATYLRQGRPTSAHRHVFLTVQAPFRPFVGASAITQIAQRAMHRAGIAHQPLHGAHTFRHTVASQMVNRGASFKDVADILGHRSLQTTGIYAKLDLDALAQVALPWRGTTV